MFALLGTLHQSCIYYCALTLSIDYQYNVLAFLGTSYHWYLCKDCRAFATLVSGRRHWLRRLFWTSGRQRFHWVTHPVWITVAALRRTAFVIASSQRFIAWTRNCHEKYFLYIIKQYFIFLDYKQAIRQCLMRNNINYGVQLQFFTFQNYNYNYRIHNNSSTITIIIIINYTITIIIDPTLTRQSKVYYFNAILKF